MLTRYALAPFLGITLLLVSGTMAFPAAIDKLNSAEAGAPDKAADSKAGGEPSAGQQSQKHPEPPYKAEDWTVAIYPILAWAPIMGAYINLPDLPPLPSLPIAGQPTGGTVTSGLNGAAFFGAALRTKRFVGDISVLWASVSASSTSPSISLDGSFIFYDAAAGVRLLRDLSFTGGVRHLGMTLDAKLGERPQVTWKPGVTDPMLGIEYRPSLGEHWGLDLDLKGGGFGAGSDVDVSGTGRLDWRFARHFGMTFGYGALHFQISSQVTTSLGTFTREVKQTLHGPIFGFGIYF